MAQIVARTNLSAKEFPFLSELSGRGIFVKQVDQNYVPQLASKEDEDKDMGIPSLFYCHNVLPTSNGYQSIDYTLAIPAPAANIIFDDVVFFRFADRNLFGHLGITSTGKVYYISNETSIWQLLVDLASVYVSGTTKISTAIVNGRTFIYLSEVGAYELQYIYSGSGVPYTYTLVSTVLAGLTASNIIGILSCQGYMLAYTKTDIGWSSLLDPTDFVPSLATGAGGGAIQGTKGSISFCVQHTIGFIVYTEQNIVSATYSGNGRFPFNFREIPSSSGVASKTLVSYDANTGNHYAYTAGGFQTVTIQQTQNILPELTDFLSGSIFEDFDSNTNTLSTTQEPSTFKKSLVLVSDRYLVISYGLSTSAHFTHALVYDLALKRWGKLKYNHTAVIDISIHSPEQGGKTPKNSFGLLSTDGNIYTVVFNIHNLSGSGVAILGKYQYVRQRTTQLHTADIENVTQGASFSCINMYSLDGKNLLAETGYELQSSTNYRKYGFNSVGVNHSLLFKGAFNLVSLVLSFSVHGRM